MKKSLCFLFVWITISAMANYPQLPISISNDFNTNFPINTYYHSDKMVDMGSHIWAVFNDTIIVKINKETGESTYAPFEMPRCAWQENINDSQNNKEWILALQKDNDNNLYIGGSWRIAKYDGTGLTDIIHARDLSWPPTNIFCYTEIAFNSQGTLFAAGSWNGFYGYPLLSNSNNNSTIAYYSFEPSSVESQETSGLKFDSKENLWICTNQGYDHSLHVLEKDSTNIKMKFHIKSEQNQEYLDPFVSMTIDNNDNIWLTSQQSGIYCYNSKQNTMQTINSTNNTEIPEGVTFTSTQKDNNENIWFCSNSLLMKYDGTHFYSYECDGIKNAICILCSNDTIWTYRSDNKITRFIENRTCETFSLNPEEKSNGTETILDNQSLTIFYSNNLLTIESNKSIGDFIIFDIIGRKIVAKTCKQNSCSFPINLSNGIYIIRTNDGNKKIAVK